MLYTFWVQWLSDPVTAPGPVTVGAATPKSDGWQLAAVEITPR